jgi:hypothetical protein
MNKDSWTFSIDLDKDELLRDTTEDSRSTRVECGRGTVRVHVNAVQLPDGFTRTVIRSSFRGYVRSVDQFAMKGILRAGFQQQF